MLSGFWIFKKPACSHQEPVDVHEQQRQEKSVEEEVEGDAGDRLEAGHACGIQHFEREPVETEPEPERDRDKYNTINKTILFMSIHLQHLHLCWASPSDAEADGAHVGQHVVKQVISSTSGLQVDVELGKL